MATWSVMSRVEPGESPEASAERVAFVREKFSFAALFLAPFVLLRYRLWLPLLAYVAVAGLLGFVIAMAGIAGPVGLVVMAGFNLLLGFELPALRVRKLAARGFAEEGVVVARDRAEAERRFFAEWTARQPERPRPAAFAPSEAPRHAGAPGIIGSFPGASAP